MSRSAASRGLALCHTCGLLQRLPATQAHGTCTRCGSQVHLRKPDSIRRSWAFLIAAAILYLPANLLPIMESTSVGDTRADTILSGVVYLWANGSADIAVIVFIASIVVPLAKLIALVWLLITVQRRSTLQAAQRTRLYRMVEFVGRWSMLDIYVAALLTALVNFNALLMVRVLPGAVAFGAVVVLTMLAAMSFDPRLIWDPTENASDA